MKITSPFPAAFKLPWRYALGLALLLLLRALTSPAQQAEQTSYPAASRIGWVNVKSYGAKGDGVTDDTKAIRKAITTYPQAFLTRIVVYFPDGKYLVSDSLRELGGYYDGYVTLQGQSRAGTVIQLKDNAPGFQDPANPRPVVYVTRGGNQSFNQYFFNLTINTGKGNPGAVALDYITNNLGAVKNVSLTSGDGQGYCGLLMDRQWPGPGLVKNVSISGFQYGVRMSNSEYSMTFENLTLSNQSVLGFRNAGNEAIIRGLTSTNAVPVIETSNQLVLLDGKFSGGKAGTAAIANSGFAYVRNTTASGYASVISTNGTAVAGTSLGEYSSQAPASLFPYSGGLSLNLPIKETPEYVNNDTTQWANVRDYGARASNRDYEDPNNRADSTPGIQAALNSGKPVVYFPRKGDNNSAYQIYKDITIPATVKLIIGFGFADIGHNNGARLLVQQASPDPLIFERIGVGPVLNTSTRAVAFKHMGGDYDNGPGSGELFLEDFVGRLVPSAPMNMWARQLNTEVQGAGDLDVLNQGGSYWILGQKTEGKAIVNKTVGGGKSEILGGLLYPAQSFGTDDKTSTALVGQEGCISAIFSASSYGATNFYPNYATETRGGVTKQLPGFTAFYRGGCDAPVPTALRQPENPAGAVAGLNYQYYLGSFNTLPDFTTLTPAKTGIVATPDLTPRTQDTNYAFRYTGYVTVPQDGQYTFYTSSDDGSRLYIGSQLVVDNDGLHGVRERSGTIGLKAGTHAVSITFFQKTGQQSLAVRYQGPGLSKQLIPASAFSYVPAATGGTGLQASYYNTQDLSGSVVLSRVDATVDFDWGTGSPAPAVNVDHFAARWTGQVLAPVTGSYSFSTVSDDGVRLWVNGQQVINNWTDHAPATDNSASVALTAGQKYDIRLEYYENSYGAVCRLQWSYPGQGSQAIPQSQLFPAAPAASRQAAPAAASRAEPGAAGEWSVYPNPAHEQLTIGLTLAQAGAVTLQLTDGVGRVVRQRTQAAEAGPQTLPLDVRGLPAGLYLLRVGQAGQTQTRKVVVQP